MTDSSGSESHNIPEFDGARGLHASWVVAYHLLTISRTPLPTRVLDGGHAVGVFFALSGFVIASLFDRRREPYLAFLTRRFFRLFPVFAVCVVPAAALSVAGLMPDRHSGAPRRSTSCSKRPCSTVPSPRHGHRVQGAVT